MIDETLIIKALGEIIIASGLFPRIAWAGRNADQTLPYLSVSLVPVQIADQTLAQDNPIWTGFLEAQIVTGLDQFETAGITLRRQLAGLFQSGDRLLLDDGVIMMIKGHPQPKTPYRDGPNQRMPLQINLTSDTVI